MELTIADLIEQCGVSSRTIRDYIARGMLPRPKGNGPAAVYGREHLLRLWAIAKLRREGLLLERIQAELGHMSAREMERCKPPAPAPAPAVGPAPEPEPAPAPAHALEPSEMVGDLPDGPRWILVSLLPGLALMVRDDAAPVVRRAAAEIVSKFGAAG